MKKIVNLSLLAIYKPVPFNQPAAPGPITPEDPVIGMAFVLFQFIFYAIIVVSILFIPWAAFLYFTSGGEEEKSRAGGTTFLGSILGIIGSVGGLYLINFLKGYFA